MDIPIVNNMRVGNIEWRSSMGKSYAFITVEVLGPNGEGLAAPHFRLYWGEATKSETDDIVKVLKAGEQWKDLLYEVNLFDFIDKIKLSDLKGSVLKPRKPLSIEEMNVTIKSKRGKTLERHENQVFENVWDALEDDPVKAAEMKLRSNLLSKSEAVLDG